MGQGRVFRSWGAWRAGLGAGLHWMEAREREGMGLGAFQDVAGAELRAILEETEPAEAMACALGQLRPEARAELAELLGAFCEGGL